jgi:ribosome-binding factor A
MKKTRRTSRVGEMIRDTLVEIFRHDLKHLQVGFASVNDVEVSPDLRVARIYMTGLDETEARATVDALQDARSVIRGFLGKRIHLRYTPELEFRYDETAIRAGRIEQILSEVIPPKVEEAAPEETDSDSEDDSVAARDDDPS